MSPNNLMRKETSAALIAGAVSALPVGVLAAAAEIFLIWRVIPALPNRNPVLLSQPVMLFLSGFMILIMVGVGAFLGLVAGLIFAKGTIKLPIQSNYVKAVIPVGVLFAVWLLYTLWFISRDVWSISRYFTYYFNSLMLTVAGFGGLALCTLLFAYLFNRWTKAPSAHETMVGKNAYCAECGAPISSNTAKFCARCGKVLP